MDDSDFTPHPLDPAVRSRTSRLLTMIALVLLVIGGFNWALVGLFNLDFVAALFGQMTLLSRLVYVAVGVAAVYAQTLLHRLAYDPV